MTYTIRPTAEQFDDHVKHVHVRVHVTWRECEYSPIYKLIQIRLLSFLRDIAHTIYKDNVVCSYFLLNNMLLVCVPISVRCYLERQRGNRNANVFRF